MVILPKKKEGKKTKKKMSCKLIKCIKLVLYNSEIFLPYHVKYFHLIIDFTYI